jgi:hypothetical protein
MYYPTLYRQVDKYRTLLFIICIAQSKKATVARRGAHDHNLPCDWFATLHRGRKLLYLVTIAPFFAR